MRGGPEPSCSPGHVGHSSGHCVPMLGTAGSPPPVLPHQGKGVGASAVFSPTHLSSLPAIWHKHRTTGSQLSEEGQEQERGGARDEVSSSLRVSEAALRESGGSKSKL